MEILGKGSCPHCNHNRGKGQIEKDETWGTSPSEAGVRGETRNSC